MRGGIISVLALLTVAVSWAQPARSANIFEKEFWMSGPRYSTKVPLCEEPGPLKLIESCDRSRGNLVLHRSFQASSGGDLER